MASESQASQSKPRSLLPRTLVVVLNPISDVPTTKLRRFSSRRFERVFENFKQCNKQSISVQLQDAVDDIQFVGWISPFTLLIHGSTEDMDVIENAWVGRMLKPPSGFLIKEFGEISELEMKQISQSQFISISDTLCDIVKGLNESQIAATFESVVSRLCSSFDSVVIPPMAAIKNCLDLLIGEQRLDFINGAYYFKSTVTVASKPRERLTTSAHMLKTEIQGPSRDVLSPKKAVTEVKSYIKKEKLNGYERLEYKKVKKRTKTRKLDNTGNCETERQKGYELNKKDQSLEKKNNGKGKKNKVVKSSSLKARKPNHCIPRRQFSYEELHSHEKRRELEDKKQIKQRNSFLGKLSRLFKMEDDKLTSNDEINNDSDNGWEKIVADEQVKLLSNQVETQQIRVLGQSREKTNRKKKPKRIMQRNVASIKQIDKTRHEGNLSRNKNVQSRRPVDNQQCPSRASSTNASSRSRSSDRGSTTFVRRNKKLEQKAKWKCSPSREQKDSAEQYSLSSYSESSCSNLNNSDYSLSSASSVDLARKSFHYSEEDTTDVESWQASREDGASNFCSTQAICGDLELSTLSLNPSRKITSSSSSSDTSSTEHVEKHLVISGMKNKGVLDQQNNLRSRNLVQLIGIL